MPPISPSTPRKRPKIDSFATSLAQLVDSLSALGRSLASDGTSNAPNIISELGEVTKQRVGFEAAVKRASKDSKRDSENQQSWKHELDRLGTDLWNRSIALRDSTRDEKDPAKVKEWRKVVAQMRLNAFEIISLGAVEPLSEKDHAALLSLSTKTVTALQLSRDDSAEDAVLGAGADHCAALNLSAIEPSATIVRAVIAHYTARMASSVKNGKLALAEWIKSKIKEEVLPFMSERERIQLAEKSYEVARWILAQPSTVDSTEADSSSSAKTIPWLLWSLELIEGITGDVSKTMQVKVLSTLAQAHLDTFPPQSGWQEAEETINQLLLLQPSPEASRRRIRLILSRNGGDGEVIEAFVQAASVTPFSEQDGVKLLHEVRKLPISRNSLTSEIVGALVTVAIVSFQRVSRTVGGESASTGASASASSSAFLGQLVMLSVLVIKDKATLCSLITRVAQDAANFRLDSNAAFLCTTYIWRAADKSHGQGGFDSAAQLYHLCTTPMMSAIQNSTWAKSFRKVALCLGEIKKFDEADENLRRAISFDDVAKSHFVRFYNFAMSQQVDKASSCLESMINANGFSVQLLLWSAKAAQGIALRPLLSKVLECLLVYCRNHSDSESSVDLLALLRCLIRLVMERMSSEPNNTAEFNLLLQRHFEMALQVARSLADSPEVHDSLTKNVSWLQKTGFNLCAGLQQPSDGDSSGLLSQVIGLMELECKLLSIPDPDTQASLWTCQLASITEEMSVVQGGVGESEQEKALQEIFGRLKRLREDVAGSKPSKSTKDTAHRVLASINGLELDARASVGDWKGALEIVKASLGHCDEKSTKLLGQRAAEDPDCPREILVEIMKLTLKSLFGSRALDPPSVASWIRFIAGFLLDDKPEEAFKYLESALSFIVDLGDLYPAEEKSWVTITAWDKGIDCFLAQLPAEGRRWCQLALRLAEAAQSRLLPKMQADFEALCEKCPMSDETEVRVSS